MKKYFTYFIVILLAGMILSSCDNWLDVTSSKEVRSKDQFKTAAGFKDALAGVYITMGQRSLYAKDMSWYLVDVLSQQYADFSTSAAYYRVGQYQYESTSAAPKLATLWENAYNAIANINNILRFIDKKQDVLDPVTHDIVKGELLGLRAFLHFDLIRLYGKGNLANRSGVMSETTIPYVTEYKKQTTPEKSYTATFLMMEQDINNALDLLKDDPIYDDPNRPADFYAGLSQNGFLDHRENRMNYYAVEALKARVLLWEGTNQKMQEAKAAAEDVINNGPVHLIDSDTYSVGTDPILYPEVIFGLKVSGFENIVNNLLNANSASNYGAVYLTNNMANDIYETSDVGIGPADVRFNTLLESQTQGLSVRKLYQGDDIRHPDVMPLIKLPEMYYIAAEYYNKNGSTAKAVDDLNTVRSSRGIIKAIPDTASQATVKNEIFKEYRKEYVSEGQLFFFYKRIGRDHFPGIPQSTTANDNIYVVPFPASESNFR